MRRHLICAALLHLTFVTVASAQTPPSPATMPDAHCPMHEQAGGPTMRPGATAMPHSQPMAEAMEHCRAMHHPDASGPRQQAIPHHDETPLSQKQEKDQ